MLQHGEIFVLHNVTHLCSRQGSHTRSSRLCCDTSLRVDMGWSYIRLSLHRSDDLRSRWDIGSQIYREWGGHVTLLIIEITTDNFKELIGNIGKVRVST